MKLPFPLGGKGDGRGRRIIGLETNLFKRVILAWPHPLCAFKLAEERKKNRKKSRRRFTQRVGPKDSLVI